MSIEVERLIVTLEAKIGGYNRNLQIAQAQTNQQLAAMEGRYAVWAAKLKSTTAMAGSSMGAIFGGIGAGLGAAAVIEYATAWTRVTRSIDGSEQVFGVALKSASQLTALANDSRVDLEAYSKLYIRTSAAIRDYGFEAGTAEKVTSTLAKALKLGGASASEQTSTLLQFSQALQKGKLDGDEFRTVMENAGVVQELLAKRLGVTKGEIINMASEGKLRIVDLVGAMVDGGDSVDRIFRQLPKTIDEAFAVLRNNTIKFIGEADQATGASQVIADGIVTISQNLKALAVAIGAILGSAAVRMLAFAAATAAAANPISLIAAAIGGLATAYGLFGDDVKLSEDGVVSLKDALSAFLDVAGGKGSETLTELGLLFEASKGKAAEWGLSLDKIGPKIAELDKKTGSFGEGAIKVFVDANLKLAEMLGLATAMGAALEFAEEVATKARRTSLLGDVTDGLGDGYRQYLSEQRASGDRKKNVDSGDKNKKRSEFEREVAQIKKRTETMMAEMRVIGQTTVAHETARAASELRFAAAETAAKQGRMVTEAEINAIDQLSIKYGEIAGQIEFLNSLQSSRDATKAINDEIALTGKFGQELLFATEQQRFLNEAKRAGVQLTTERQAEIDALARQNAAAKQFAQTVSDIREESRDALKTFVNDLREGKSAGEAMADVLDNIADKLIDMAINGLVEQALGGLTNTGAAAASGGSAGSWVTAVLAAADGGYVSGRGSSRSDSIPARLSNGEYVVNAKATSKHRDLLDSLNFGSLPAYASGGPVGPSMPSIAIPSAVAPASASSAAASSAPVVNVTANFNVQNGTPEGIDKLRNEVAKAMPALVRRAMNEAFDRDARFARSRI